MNKMYNNGVFCTVNASGAAGAAEAGNVVVIVDVIDMSTTLEAALDGGAARVFGAAPDESRAPVKLDPESIGRLAGRAAVEQGAGVIIVAEPRVGTEEQRRARCSKVIRGVEQAGAAVEAVLPNTGAETGKLAEWRGKIVIAVSDTGGVAFDAAVASGAPEVLTGTIARTMQKRGLEPVRAAAGRAVEAARRLKTGIAVVAASANSLEDVLAAEYIMREILALGFTAIP